MPKRIVAALVLAVSLAACGGGGGSPRGSAPATPAAPSSTPPAAPPSAAVTVSTPAYGPLPLPRDAATLEARLRAMPDTIGKARKMPYEAGYVRYAADGKEFGIEAADVEDVTRAAGTTADAFDRMRAEFASPPAGCAQPPARCLAGRSDGQRAVMWGHDDGPIMLVALAPDEATLRALLRAWAAAG